ncbi:Cdc37 N terminal kinase binding-domain-containing protein, partial [Globomyces pollinis-pini]
KWDSIELSDDEDFECHPNVDKKSMIRWKQSQIHKQRQERLDQKELLTLEYSQTEKYLKFIETEINILTSKNRDEILLALTDLSERVDSQFTDPLRQMSMTKMSKWPGNWEPPEWGPVIRSHVPWTEEIKQIQKSVEDRLKDTNVDLKLVLTELFEESNTKFKLRQPVIQKQIDEFEDLKKKKITMDNLSTGFNSTYVSKSEPKNVAPAADQTTSSTGKQIETIHTPNSKPIYFSKQVNISLHEVYVSMDSTDEKLVELHPQLLTLSRTSDYGIMVKILKQFPDIQKEKNEETLLLRVLCLQIIGNAKEAKNCVLVTLILKYTRSLGTVGVDAFFSNAQKLFFEDVDKTYEHITNRGAILRKERLDKKQAQLQQEKARKELIESFTQPDGTFKLPVGESPSEMELKQAEWFDNLPHDYKVGLLYEDVDKINAYLGSLPEEEASYQAQLAVKAGFIQFEEEDDEELE